MDQKDIEYFRKLLTSMLEEAKQKGDSTIEELTDSNEVFADPADRATAESDRAFTLRIRDRERRLIRKIQSALQRHLRYLRRMRRRDRHPPSQGPSCHPSVHQLQGQAGRGRTSARRLARIPDLCRRSAASFDLFTKNGLRPVFLFFAPASRR